MTARGNVAVRVDASTAIGLGHLRRCLTLVRQLRQDGFTPRLISRRPLAAPIDALIDKDIRRDWLDEASEGMGDPPAELDESRDAEQTLSIVGRNPSQASWVVVDHYGLGERWERIIGEAGHRVLAIDDFRNRSHFADILVGDSDAPFDPHLNGKTAKILVGAAFTLIDPEFAWSEEPNPMSGSPRVLISYGGSDPTGETIKALAAIRLLQEEPRQPDLLAGVDVVVGQANLRAAAIAHLASALPGVIVHIAPPSLAPLMRTTDVFLTAGGNSLIEGLVMRKRCLVTVTSDNQALMVAQLAHRGVIVSLGAESAVSDRDMADALAKLVADAPFAHHLKSQAIFDHLGAQRVSAAIQAYGPLA